MAVIHACNGKDAETYRTASERPNLTYLTEGKHARLFGCLPYYKLTRLHDCSASNVITTGHVRVSGT